MSAEMNPTDAEVIEWLKKAACTELEELQEPTYFWHTADRLRELTAERDTAFDEIERLTEERNDVLAEVERLKADTQAQLDRQHKILVGGVDQVVDDFKTEIARLTRKASTWKRLAKGLGGTVSTIKLAARNDALEEAIQALLDGGWSLPVNVVRALKRPQPAPVLAQEADTPPSAPHDSGEGKKAVSGQDNGSLDYSPLAKALWGDPDVQKVYEVLCDGAAFEHDDEHWEGWIARRIVDALRAPSEAVDPEHADGDTVAMAEPEKGKAQALWDCMSCSAENLTDPASHICENCDEGESPMFAQSRPSPQGDSAEPEMTAHDWDVNWPADVPEPLDHADGDIVAVLSYPNYSIAIEQGESGLFHATSREVPGLFCSGETVEELRAHVPFVVQAIREAEAESAAHRCKPLATDQWPDFMTGVDSHLIKTLVVKPPHQWPLCSVCGKPCIPEPYVRTGPQRAVHDKCAITTFMKAQQRLGVEFEAAIYENIEELYDNDPVGPQKAAHVGCRDARAGREF